MAEPPVCCTGILQVVLFNIGSVYNKLGQLKTEFWKYSHIGIPDPDTESNDAVVLGFLVAQFIGEVRASMYCFINLFLPGY